MEAGISPNQFPDMDFMEEFINKEGYKNGFKMIQHQPLEPLSIWNQSLSLIHSLRLGYLRISCSCSYASWLQFCEGMETRGLAFDGSPEPKNMKLSLPQVVQS